MYFGPPARLLTDNGSNFRAGVMEDLYTLFKINKIWTSPYHPQTYSSVERFNRTLNAMLSHFVDTERQDDWDQFLPLVIFAYISTFNPAIGTAKTLKMKIF
jgi:transposase InsO family protein